MDHRLTTEELDWLRKIREATRAKQPSPDLPLDVARKLTMLGCAVLTAGGRYTITLRGRDELIESERERTIS